MTGFSSLKSHLPFLGWQVPDNFNRYKQQAIDFAFGECAPAPRSFADLGGIWAVDGAYTFYTLRDHRPERAALVDTDFSPASLDLAKSRDNLTLIHGNFGDRGIAEQVGGVDAVFLFDVLLHQVDPDWDAILALYAPRTDYFVIYNQQWIGSSETVRLLDLGQKDYFANVPHDENDPTYRDLFDKLDDIHPQHGRPWRDVHNIWQWGITDQSLLSVMGDLGFKLQWYRNCHRFGDLANFENHAFVFQKEASYRSDGGG